MRHDQFTNLLEEHRVANISIPSIVLMESGSSVKNLSSCTSSTGIFATVNIFAERMNRSMSCIMQQYGMAVYLHLNICTYSQFPLPCVQIQIHFCSQLENSSSIIYLSLIQCRQSDRRGKGGQSLQASWAGRAKDLRAQPATTVYASALSWIVSKK